MQILFQNPSRIFVGADAFIWVGFNEQPDEEGTVRIRQPVESVNMDVPNPSQDGYLVRLTGKNQTLDWYQKIQEKDHAMVVVESQQNRYEIDPRKHGFLQLAEQFHTYILENHAK